MSAKRKSAHHEAGAVMMVDQAGHQLRGRVTIEVRGVVTEMDHLSALSPGKHWERTLLPLTLVRKNLGRTALQG